MSLRRSSLIAGALLSALSLAAAAPVAAQDPALPAAAQASSLPGTPAGAAVRRWLEALNSPDPQAIQTVDPRGFGVRAQTGGLDLIAVEQSSDSAITAVVRQRIVGNYLRATWSVQPGDPPAIVGFRATPTDAPPGQPAMTRLDDRQLAAYLDGLLDRADYAGVVLVARHGKPVYTAARGLADRENKIPVALDTRFRIGSMDKMFTAVAVLQLVQAGKVKLDAPIGTYLKDYPNPEFASTVTVHQLLTHTGGAGDIFGPQFEARRLQLKSLKDYVALYGARPTEFKPGTAWRYANYGFILLGRIVEEVSGQSYPDYVRDHIFRPAGMTRSGFEPESTPVEGRARPYTFQPNGYVLAENTLPWSGTSAGGGYSSGRDMLAFATALTGHKLLDAEHTRLLTTRKANGNYAYGFEELRADGVRIVGHNGGAPGQNGDLRMIGDGQGVIVALTNVAPPGRASQVTQQILNRMAFTTPDGRVAKLASGGPGSPAYEAERLAAFKAADRGGAGRLDKAAYREVLKTLAYEEQLDALFAQRDVNRDGFISLEEYRPPAQQAAVP